MKPSDAVLAAWCSLAAVGTDVGVPLSLPPPAPSSSPESSRRAAGRPQPPPPLASGSSGLVAGVLSPWDPPARAAALHLPPGHPHAGAAVPAAAARSRVTGKVLKRVLSRPSAAGPRPATWGGGCDPHPLPSHPRQRVLPALWQVTRSVEMGTPSWALLGPLVPGCCRGCPR